MFHITIKVLHNDPIELSKVNLTTIIEVKTPFTRKVIKNSVVNTDQRVIRRSVYRLNLTFKWLQKLSLDTNFLILRRNFAGNINKKLYKSFSFKSRIKKISLLSRTILETAKRNKISKIYGKRLASKLLNRVVSRASALLYSKNAKEIKAKKNKWKAITFRFLLSKGHPLFRSFLHQILWSYRNNQPTKSDSIKNTKNYNHVKHTLEHRLIFFKIYYSISQAYGNYGFYNLYINSEIKRTVKLARSSTRKQIRPLIKKPRIREYLVGRIIADSNKYKSPAKTITHSWPAFNYEKQITHIYSINSLRYLTYLDAPKLLDPAGYASVRYDFPNYLYTNTEKILTLYSTKIDRFIYKRFSYKSSKFKLQYLYPHYVNYRYLFKNQIREQHLFRWLYRISYKQIVKIFKKVVNYTKRRFEYIFLKYLEYRIDICLYRINFVFSTRQARQWVKRQLFVVNDKVVNWPKYQINIGDVVIPIRLLRSQTWPTGDLEYNNDFGYVYNSIRLFWRPIQADQYPDYFIINERIPAALVVHNVNPETLYYTKPFSIQFLTLSLLKFS